MGLIANVYRQVNRQFVDGTASMVDCTNGGWSSRFNTVCVVNMNGPFDPDPATPAVMLIDGPGPDPNPIIVLEEHYRANKWTMFGGNFLYTSDSRFSEAVRDILGTSVASFAIRIHDRIEG